MTFFIIQPALPIAFGWADYEPKEHIYGEGEFYHLVEPNTDLVFYEWLRDSKSRIVGLELHLFPRELEGVSDLLTSLPKGETLFPQILFVRSEIAKSAPQEAFGDIYFYRSADHRWLIVVGTEQWLSDEDRLRLKQLARASHLSISSA